MKKNEIIRILIVVFAVLIAALLIGGGIYLVTASKKIQSLQLTPDFGEQQIGVGQEYSFTITATPAKASTKKVKAVCDDPSATFEISKDGKAKLVTGMTEGTVTVYVEYKKIKSNEITFQVVDLVAQEMAAAQAAAAEAEAAAQAAAAEEAAAAEAAAVAVKEYVKMTGDNVNIRSQNNTDCDILGKAKKGDVFEKVETVDDWTHIIYSGRDGYIKSEYLTTISEEEATGAGAQPEEAQPTAAETKPEEKKEETPAAPDPAAEAAQKAAEEAAAAAAAQMQAQQEALAAQQAAAAAAAAAGTPIACKDGTCYVTPAQLQKIHATWDFAGDAIEMAGHHSIGELEAVIGPTRH